MIQLNCLLPFVNAAGNAFGHVSLSMWVCVCPARALTCEGFDPEISFLICRYIFGIYRSSSYIKVIRPRSRSQEQKGQRSVTKYTHSRMIHLWLNGSIAVADPGFLWRGCGGVWPPIFFGRDDPTFYDRLLARIGIARIFKGWVRPGVDPGFLVGGTIEAPSEAR